MEVRKNFEKYFVSKDGEVAWQYDIVRKGKFAKE